MIDTLSTVMRLLVSGRGAGRRAVLTGELFLQMPRIASVTDGRTGDAHLVTEDAILAGRGAGCFVAVCGMDVLAARLTTPELGFCKFCAQCWGAR